MSCILRFSGDCLNVTALIDAISMTPDRTWVRGEPRSSSLPDSSKYTDSGLTFLVSNADFTEFDAQVIEATSFLVQHREDILKISQNDEVDYGTLDFGVSFRDVSIHSDILTPSFLNAIAGLNLEVEISHYPCEG